VASDRRSEIVEGFTRQARAFATSPLQRDEARLRRLVERVGPVPGERGLDVACGPGIVARALAERGAFVVGTDLTQEMLRQAVAGAASRDGGAWQEGSASREGAPGIGLARSEAEHLPFPGGAFDFAVCRNSFHHFLDPPAVLGEMIRVTRPGGRIVIEDMIAPEGLIDRDEHEVVERLRDRAHVRTLTQGEFGRLSAQAGLTRVEALEFEILIDFEEWIDRAFPPPAARDRARRLVESCVGSSRGGRRAFVEDGRLKFVRRSQILRAVRP
jgi:ubiquinone/menaquinone biosynthesis C-methylase UbiE